MKKDAINQSEQGWKLQKNSSITTANTEHSSILDTLHIEGQESQQENQSESMDQDN